MTTFRELRPLTIELVPETCWYSNLRKAVKPSVWDRLRKQAYSDANCRCEVCGRSGVRLECHEKWSYDDEHHIQHLEGFVALCAMCHHVKHIGLARILATEGRLDYNRVIEHYCRINGCTFDDFIVDRETAFAIWQERGKYVWITDLGDHAPLVKP